MSICYIKDISVDCDFPNCGESDDVLLSITQRWENGIKQLENRGWQIDLKKNKAFCTNHKQIRKEDEK